MQLDKKKYKASEVEMLLQENSFAYEEKLKEQRTRLRELIEENNQLLLDLEYYKEKEANIVNALTDSEEKAESVRKKNELQYALTVQSLKEFNEKWMGYFKQLREKYPTSNIAEKALKLQSCLEKLLIDGNNRVVVDSLDKQFSNLKNKKTDVFNPKQKINEYIAATDGNGFNLDEVLNPGVLELEDLCKELGLIDEKE